MPCRKVLNILGNGKRQQEFNKIALTENKIFNLLVLYGNGELTS
jgi:hypothetical protein